MRRDHRVEEETPLPSFHLKGKTSYSYVKLPSMQTFLLKGDMITEIEINQQK